MSKKNSNVILKNGFKNFEDLHKIYSLYKNKLKILKNKKFLIAVSGGPDSLALTALSKSLSYEHKFSFIYALVDHNLRQNSSLEANSVKRLLNKYKINLKILKNKKSIKKNLQSEARNIRYRLLTSFCKKKKIKTILTAHNLEDQVETFFIRLSRGSGIHGLSSMRKNIKIENDINLMRPLLDIKKSQLKKISKIVFGKFYKDPTNKDTRFLRTRIRNLRKSIEESGINYDQIIQSINNLASSRDTIELYFKKIYKNITKKDSKKILINLKQFNNINEEMKMRVLEKAIKDFTKVYYSSRSKKILYAINQLKAKKNAKLTLGGCIIFRQKNHIILIKENKIKRF